MHLTLVECHRSASDSFVSSFFDLYLTSQSLSLIGRPFVFREPRQPPSSVFVRFLLLLGAEGLPWCEGRCWLRGSLLAQRGAAASRYLNVMTVKPDCNSSLRLVAFSFPGRKRPAEDFHPAAGVMTALSSESIRLRRRQGPKPILSLCQIFNFSDAKVAAGPSAQGRRRRDSLRRGCSAQRLKRGRGKRSLPEIFPIFL